RQAAEPAIPVQQLHMPLGHAGGHCKLIDSAVVSHALDSPELGWPVCRLRLLLAPVGGTPITRLVAGLGHSWRACRSRSGPRRARTSCWAGTGCATGRPAAVNPCC